MSIDPKTPDTKQKEALSALKGANAHLTTVFNSLQFLNSCAGSAADQLRYIASKCGDFKINVIHEQKWQDISLKQHLNDIASYLEKARI